MPLQNSGMKSFKALQIKVPVQINNFTDKKIILL